VALELQADFYAGVWTHYNQQMNTILEDGDIDEALVPHAVGDDAINLKCKVILFGIFYTEPLNN
jgi:predicted metalloprotease